MAEGKPDLLTPITEAPVYLKVEAWYAAAAEGALHLEDILARRMRISIEYPHRGVDCAREVAEVVAPMLGWSAEDVDREVRHVHRAGRGRGAVAAAARRRVRRRAAGRGARGARRDPRAGAAQLRPCRAAAGARRPRPGAGAAARRRGAGRVGGPVRRRGRARKCLPGRWSAPTARWSTAATVLPPGAHVYLYRELPDEVPVPFDIPVLYRDDDIVVVDKPHFLATMPRGRHVAQTALVRLRRELDLPELSPAHRLDRLTAGRAAVHGAARGARRVSDAVRARARCARRIWRGRPSTRRSSCRRWCAAESSSGADSYRPSRNRVSRTPRRWSSTSATACTG